MILGYIQISCKFRAWGITFGTLSKEWSVSEAFVFDEVPFSETPPTTAKKLLDWRGVKLFVWR